MSALAQRRVLVLNKNTTAVGVVSLQRAIIMLFSFDPKTDEPKAQIMDEGCALWTWEEWAMLCPDEGEDAIHTCQGRFKIPEIIKLSKYDRLPQQQLQFSRRMVYKRDGGQCIYCHKRPPTEDLSIDHIIPRSGGGLTTWDNCVLACTECNSKKANKMPDRTTILDHVKDDSGKPKEVHVPAFTVYFTDKTRKTIKQPKRPNFEVFKGELPYRSWGQWLNIPH